MRRRTFPRNVLRVGKSYVRQGIVARPSRVFSIAADELLEDQIRGGTRRPTGGHRRLLVPENKRRRPRKNIYRADKYLFAARKRGPSKYVGTLERKVRIPRRFDLERALRRVGEGASPRIGEASAKGTGEGEVQVGCPGRA